MKRYLPIFISLIIISLCNIKAVSQGTGIGTQTPDPSAMLELQGISKGFLFPRVTNDQFSQITNPPAGLLIYCTDCNSTGGFYVYQNNSWVSITPPLNAPVSSAASNVSCDAFRANWNPVSGAEGYYLDVSTTSSFISKIIDNKVVNTTSYDISGLENNTDYFYRVLAFDPCKTSEYSSTQTTKTTGQPPVITSQPPDENDLCTSSSINFGIAATGSVSYSWEYSPDNTNWTVVTNGTPTGASYFDANTEMITISGISIPGTFYYRCVTSNACATVASESSELNIIRYPEVTGQPAGRSICSAGSTTLSVTANNADTYSWEYSPDGIYWSAVADGTPAGADYSNQFTPNLGVSGIVNSGTYNYHCVITNSCTNVSSNTSSVNVTSTPEVTLQPAANLQYCPGNNISLTVAGTGITAYQWQIFNSGSWVSAVNNIPAGAIYTGTQTATLGISGNIAAGSYTYRCVISNSCSSSNSNSSIITVPSDPSISGQPGNKTICPAGSASFSVTASNATGYTWKYSADNYNWTDVSNGTPSGAVYSGSNTANLSVSSINIPGTGYYECILSGTCQTISSNSSTLTVEGAPVITSQPSNTCLCPGNTAYFTVAATGSGLTYRWQYSWNGGAWGDVTNNQPVNAVYTGSNTATLGVSGINFAVVNNRYRCIITNSCGAETISNPGILSIDVISAQPINRIMCAAGNTSTLHIQVSGSATSYQWEYLNGAVWTPVANGTPAGASYAVNNTSNTSDLDVSNIANAGTYTYRCQVTNYCCTFPSDNGTVTVYARPVPTISGVASACVNSNQVYTTEAGKSSYTWGVTGGQIISGGSSADNTATIKWTSAGLGSVSVNYLSSGCNALSATVKNVTVNALPVPSLNGETTVCSGIAKTYTTEAGMSGYLWTVSGGTINGSANSSSVSVTWTTAGSRTISITYTNGSGCSGVTSRTITVNATPSISLSGQTSPCPNVSYNYTATAVTGGQYYWTTGVLPLPYPTSQNYLPVSWMTPGASSVTVYVVDGSNCTSNTASVAVNVLSQSTAPTGISATSTNICSGSTVTLTQSGGTLGSGASWVWYSGSCAGTYAGTGASINVTPGATTTYFVRAEGGCVTTGCAQVTITVNSYSAAPASVTANPSSILQGQSTQLTLSGGSLGSGANWYWYSGGCAGTLIASGVTSVTVTPSATTSYYVKAIGTCNTTACAGATVTVTPVLTDRCGVSMTVSAIGFGSQVWLDRNVDAPAAATGGGDLINSGGLYQWGRWSDGHQCIAWTNLGGTPVNGTTSSLSASEKPNHNLFIIGNNDWYTGPLDLWQGGSGVNNPCPSGYRLPTRTEWDTFINTLTVANRNSAGAYAAIKITKAGVRTWQTGSLTGAKTYAWYWSSSDNGTNSYRAYFDATTANTQTGGVHAEGSSVRCIAQ